MFPLSFCRFPILFRASGIYNLEFASTLTGSGFDMNTDPLRMWLMLDNCSDRTTKTHLPLRSATRAWPISSPDEEKTLLSGLGLGSGTTPTFGQDPSHKCSEIPAQTSLAHSRHSRGFFNQRGRVPRVWGILGPRPTPHLGTRFKRFRPCENTPRRPRSNHHSRGLNFAARPGSSDPVGFYVV